MIQLFTAASFASKIKVNWDLVKLSATAFGQIALVTASQWLITHGYFAAAVGVGFFISIIWTLNIKRVAFGCWRERIVYAASAMLGTVVGLYGTDFILGR